MNELATKSSVVCLKNRSGCFLDFFKCLSFEFCFHHPWTFLSSMNQLRISFLLRLTLQTLVLVHDSTMQLPSFFTALHHKWVIFQCNYQEMWEKDICLIGQQCGMEGVSWDCDCDHPSAGCCFSHIAKDLIVPPPPVFLEQKYVNN